MAATPAIILTGAVANPNATAFSIRYRLHTGPGAWNYWPEQPNSTTRVVLAGELASLTAYDVEIAYKSVRGVWSNYTALSGSPYTTGDAVAPPPADNSITTPKVVYGVTDAGVLVETAPFSVLASAAVMASYTFTPPTTDVLDTTSRYEIDWGILHKGGSTTTGTVSAWVQIDYTDGSSSFQNIFGTVNDTSAPLNFIKPLSWKNAVTKYTLGLYNTMTSMTISLYAGYSLGSGPTCTAARLIIRDVKR